MPPLKVTLQFQDGHDLGYSAEISGEFEINQMGDAIGSVLVTQGRQEEGNKIASGVRSYVHLQKPSDGGNSGLNQQIEDERNRTEE